MYAPTRGILDSARCFGSLLILTENLALKAGSSKHGKAVLANVGSNCVAASTLRKKEKSLVHIPSYAQCSAPGVKIK